MHRIDAEELKRIRWRQGQMLRSADFTEQAALDVELRSWHNRALHDAAGVVSGLSVELVERESKLIATVAPGLAYSASGEILLRSGQGLIEVPLSEQPLALVLTNAGAACATADGDDGACLFGERAGEADIAELRWVDARRVDRRHDVLLAWVVTEDLDALPDGLDAGLSNRAVYVADRKAIVALCPISQGERAALLNKSDDQVFQSAVQSLSSKCRMLPMPTVPRPLARPRVASGSTPAGATAWEPWTVAASNIRRSRETFRISFQVPIGFQVRIDTSAEGFTRVPHYFASLQGPLVSLTSKGIRVGGRWEHIEAASIDGFTYRAIVLLQEPIESAVQRSGQHNEYTLVEDAWAGILKQLREGECSVSWLAIEPESQSRPGIRPREVLRGHIR